MVISLISIHLTIVFYAISFFLGYLDNRESFREWVAAYWLFGFFLVLDAFFLIFSKPLTDLLNLPVANIIFYVSSVEKVLFLCLFYCVVRILNRSIGFSVPKRILILLESTVTVVLLSRIIISAVQFLRKSAVRGLSKPFHISELLSILSFFLGFLTIYIFYHYSRVLKDKKERKDYLVHMVLTILIFPLMSITRDSIHFRSFFRGLFPMSDSDSFLIYVVPNFYFLICFCFRSLFVIGNMRIYRNRQWKQIIEEKSDYFQLTEREQEIVYYLVLRKSITSIADSCNISSRTVEKHLSNIFRKCRVNNKFELLLRMKNGISQSS